jgi:carboxymethylenebutenolidase
MATDRYERKPGDAIARRDFAALSVAAGLAATASSAAAADVDVVETDVEIKTPDGTCDAAFIHPKTGSYPGVLIWPDAFGLRPAMRDMAKRLAAEGYSVLVPNPFYRISKAPFTDASNFSFQNPADMAKLRPLMASVNAAGQRGEGCRRLRGLPRRAKTGEQGKEDRDPGLLHGRSRW